MARRRTAWLERGRRASPLVDGGAVLRLEHGAALPRPLLARRRARSATTCWPALAAAAAGRRRGRAGRRRARGSSPAPAYDEQRAAARAAARQWTTVLTGGPGTGKTTTVAGLLALLAEQAAAPRPAAPDRADRPDRQGGGPAPGGGRGRDRARCPRADRAPARRAAGRRRCTGCSAGGPTTAPASGTTAATGCRTTWSWSTSPRWSSLTMMARLLEAVRPDARLVLVGDPDQLASVEAGAVLADLVAGLRRRRRTARWCALDTTHRFGERDRPARRGAARRRRRRRARRAARRCRRGRVPRDGGPGAALRSELVAAAARRSARTPRPGDADGGGRRARPAPAAVRAPRRTVRRDALEPPGRALARRGDRGPALRPDGTSDARCWSPPTTTGSASTTATPASWCRPTDGAARGHRRRRGAGRLRDQPARRDVETMHAMTIHKSQGSQADEVTVLLPPRRVAAADPRAVLHRGHPREGQGAGGRHRGRGARGGRPPGPARERAAAAAVMTGSGPLRATTRPHAQGQPAVAALGCSLGRLSLDRDRPSG